MDRFLSNAINKVDKKGRVSIPASFRPVLGSQNRLYVMLSVDQPTVEAGGEALLEAGEAKLATLDPFSSEYETYSFLLHGDSAQLKIDGEGRIILTDQIRNHAGIEDRVAFVGRGHFFQLWEPGQFEAYRKAAREKVAQMRSGTQVLAGAGRNPKGER